MKDKDVFARAARRFGRGFCRRSGSLTRRDICMLVAVLAFAPHAVFSQTTCSPTAVRIDYEAQLPGHVVAVAQRSAIQRAFPQVNGITERTVYITREQRISIERGQALRSHVVSPPAIAPGTHLGNDRGEVFTWIGYEAVPLTIQSIETRHDKVKYDSLSGKARRTVRHAPDAEERGLLDILEGDVVTLGERTYAGRRCTAAHSPQWGAGSEVCVANINGWPTALYLQLPSADLGWYRATRITQACASAAEARLPAGVAIVDRDTSSSDDTDEPEDDAEE